MKFCFVDWLISHKDCLLYKNKLKAFILFIFINIFCNKSKKSHHINIENCILTHSFDTDITNKRIQERINILEKNKYFDINEDMINEIMPSLTPITIIKYKEYYYIQDGNSRIYCLQKKYNNKIIEFNNIYEVSLMKIIFILIIIIYITYHIYKAVLKK